MRVDKQPQISDDGRPTLLLVDDDSVFCHVRTRALERRG